MAAAKPVMVQAGDRRSASPARPGDLRGDRPHAEVTKLMVAEYFASRRRRADAGAARPADRARALDVGGPARDEAGHRTAGPGRRRVLPEARAEGRPRLPRVGRPSPSRGRTAEEICPTEIAVPVWCAHMGTLTFHPWPVRRDDVDHPDELRIDLDPQPGTSFADAVRVAGVARELLDELGLVGFAKTSGNRGVHVYVRIRPEWDFIDVRHAAIGFGRELEKRDDEVTTAWWKEERGERIFVDYNQNCRDRTIASAYSLRPSPARRSRRR